MQSKIVFVILHYCAVQSTIDAVESIRKYSSTEIVIVDNASPDKSGFELLRKYSHAPNIYVILNQSNEGFARGNNIGYRYSRDKLHADFIVIINNDVLVIQPNFTQMIRSIYSANRFDILGPDIITPEGNHRNPHRYKTFSKKELNRIIRNRTIILLYLRLKYILGITSKILFLEKWDAKRSEKERNNIDRDHIQYNIVLQGSCLIFSPDYIRKETIAFYPETFMWMEEEILTFLCQQKGYTICYNPKIKVLHKEEISTKSTFSQNNKYYFFSQQLRKSASIMKKLILQYEKKDSLLNDK